MVPQAVIEEIVSRTTEEPTMPTESTVSKEEVPAT